VQTLCGDGMSTLCSGEIYDCGGPDGDYEANSNYTFTIAPAIPSECINFTMEYFNLENGFNANDVINFYDGLDNSGTPDAQINGFGDGANFGGVCYQFAASSGALTIEFISDGATQFEGFHGFWECSSEPCVDYDIVQVTPTTIEDSTAIVLAVSSPETTVFLDTIICPDGSIGTFLAEDEDAGFYTDLGISKGLVLSSGEIGDIPNPGQTFSSTVTGSDGDADLDWLSLQSGGANPSNDACIVEFDVFVPSDQLEFEYVFGSEEYPEFAESNFNDIFGFFASGPGIVGDPGLTNSAVNIATLPDGTAVEIQGVNQFQNWEYYRDNSDGQSVVYDGLTSDFLGVKKSLTAAVETIPCNTYHLKMAIADRGDSSFDSGVFVGDIRGGSDVEFDIVFNNGIDYLVENCGTVPDLVNITLNEPQDQDITFEVQIGGTAIQNVDYTTNIPSQITFLAGDTLFQYSLAVINDAIQEMDESIILTLIRDFGCGQVSVDEVVIDIQDALEIDVNGGADTVFVCAGTSVQLEATGAFGFTWQPEAIFDNNALANPTATPTEDVLVAVVGQLGPCIEIDQVFLDVVSPELDITTPDLTNTCEGTNLTLTAENNTGNSNLMWTPAFGLSSDSDLVVTTDLPPGQYQYEAMVELAGCTAMDTITINVDEFDFPGLQNDTLICQGYSVFLGENIGDVTTDFVWSPSETLDDETSSNPLATPQESTAYTISALSASGACSAQGVVNVIVVPADVDLMPDVDTLEICLNETVTLETTSTTGGLGVTWSTDDPSFVQIDNETATVQPDQSYWYFTQLDVDACSVFDSLYIRVDSLPNLAINELIPDKESYCEGEQITIVSAPPYEPANFPDITHLWNPTTGALTPDSLWNLVITAEETTTYIRTSTNHACQDTASITIEVNPTAEVIITPNDSSICPGESISLQVTADEDITEWTWTVVDGSQGSLSCEDCDNPMASPSIETTYMVDGEYNGCPAQAMATVDVVSIASNISNQSICAGESTSFNFNGTAAATYTWFDADGNEIATGPNPVLTPATTTTYTVVGSLDDCEVQTDVTVTVESGVLALELGQDVEICEGLPVSLTALAVDANNGGAVAGTYTWTLNDQTFTEEYNGASGFEASSFNFTSVVGEGGAATVTFQPANDCGTDPVTGMVNLTVVPQFTITSTTSDVTEIFEGGTINLAVTTDPAQLDDPTYDWTNSDANQANVAIVTSPFAPGPTDPEGFDVQTYQVVITDQYGCSAEDAVSINVKEVIEPSFPTIFAPDSENEFDRIYAPIVEGGQTLTEFRIYNRWGNVVFDIQDAGGATSWDGNINGKPAPADVYMFVATVIEEESGLEKPYSGEITMIR